MDTPVNRGGRPRSEQARDAVLHAVDDLLLEVGYSAMTMKGIAERAGVGRQTVYRWWSTKAEILFEATVADAEEELAVPPTGSSLDDLVGYLDSLKHFLEGSAAGAAYRALIAAAQQDRAVAALLASKDVLGDSARVVVERVAEHEALPSPPEHVTALLVGPMFFWVMSGRDTVHLDTGELAATVLSELRAAKVG
ncbi:TetR/AcrR family transcriptional regulator [Umezawaea tangerina]|uniref:TetR family transcriptional regulator n=1 Tax=Umezawaea tangerina TaxID=84725 RepID=A0A2T0T232_9PSEU|nr:TetR/AcrR family transcriptional regulator [Umezawaea tangerina]PRY39704.1 TetR family transcriptional regulator [Umezawaea tangerina]